MVDMIFIGHLYHQSMVSDAFVWDVADLILHHNGSDAPFDFFRVLLCAKLVYITGTMSPGFDDTLSLYLEKKLPMPLEILHVVHDAFPVIIDHVALESPFRSAYAPCV